VRPNFNAEQVLTAPDFESLGRVRDVARLLNVSRSWVHLHKHEIPHLRIGGLLRFDLAEVRSWSLRQRAGEMTRLEAEIVRLRGETVAGSGKPAAPRAISPDG
jgi:excisionase family DNA binding protein